MVPDQAFNGWVLPVSGGGTTVQTLIETKTLAGVNSTTFAGLNGDTQLLYLIQGQVLLGGAGGSILKMRPNGANTNIGSSVVGNGSGGGGPFVDSNTDSFILHHSTFSPASQIAFNGYLNASSTFVTNGARTFAGTSIVYDASGPRTFNYQASGAWWVVAAGNNMTSLDVFCSNAGVTMTGSISLYRLSRT